MNGLLRLVQIITRLFSGARGLGLFLMSVSLSLIAAAFPQGEVITPGWQIITFVIGTGALVASGFLMFSLGWPTRFARASFRWTTTLLLLVPLAVGCVLVNATRTQFPPVELAFMLIGFTGWLLLLCVKPALLATKEK
jgi:hypothetical protein